MDTLTIRQKLYEYIKVADDKKVEAIYTIIKDDVNMPYEWWNDDDMVTELEQISKDMESGRDKGFTLEESKLQTKFRLSKNG